MSTYLPTLKQLQYLVALKENGHFGKAAEACFVTQSTLSAGIKELEALLDIVLVERTRRVVRFTDLGNQMVEKAYRILREAEELSEMARSAGKPLAGDIRMSVIPTIAPFLLPRLLPQLRKERPELKLYLKEETSQAACDSLHHGHADCVLLAQPFPCGDVESEVLFSYVIFVAFPKNDPRDPPRQVDPAENGYRQWHSELYRYCRETAEIGSGDPRYRAGLAQEQPAAERISTAGRYYEGRTELGLKSP